MNPKIQSTQDYKLFKRIRGNRKVIRSHVNKLRSAFEENPKAIEYNPILVNENMEIIDGQHRFDAASQLELPIYYQKVPGLTLHDVQVLNSNTRTWTPIDFAEAFAEIGLESYKLYLAHKKKYKLAHDVTMAYVGVGVPNTSTGFRTGRFRAGDQKRTKQYSDWLVEIKKYVEYANLRPAAMAFLKVAQHPDYNHERMFEKLAKHGAEIESYTQHLDALRAFEKVYNHSMSEKNFTRFF